MPESQPLLIASLPPTRAQERIALAIALALLAFFVAAVLADAPLPRIDAVIPAVSTLMFAGDSVSAVLLFGQFAVLRSRALLVLAAGYLFTGLLVLPYALTFPGAFATTGLMGAGLQTAGWIFVVWHAGLPVAAIAYVWLSGANRDQQVKAPPASAIAAAAAAAVALAALVAVCAIAFQDSLPRITVDAVRMSRNEGVRVGMILLSAGALLLLARRRRSVLDLWLLVVLFAWLLDSMLTYATGARYTTVWYANRVVRVVAANVVLFAMLAETMHLYAKLASAVVAQRRERQSRMMTMEAMSAAIEHELRQPLAAIVANAGAARRWLARSPPDAVEAAQSVEQIEEEGRRAANILASVRRLFAAQDAPASESLDANAIVQDTIAVARVRLDSSAIGVQLQLDPRLPRLAGNEQQLREVLMNLVNNAADAMRTVAQHAALLSITTNVMDGRKIEIAVADTGTGVDPGDMERIFEAFFTTKPDGMGMGLALCRTIVERHGGTLSVSRGTPYGSVFRVVLPSA